MSWWRHGANLGIIVLALVLGAPWWLITVMSFVAIILYVFDAMGM